MRPSSTALVGLRPACILASDEVRLSRVRAALFVFVSMKTPWNRRNSPWNSPWNAGVKFKNCPWNASFSENRRALLQLGMRPFISVLNINDNVSFIDRVQPGLRSSWGTLMRRSCYRTLATSSSPGERHSWSCLRRRYNHRDRLRRQRLLIQHVALLTNCKRKLLISFLGNSTAGTVW